MLVEGMNNGGDRPHSWTTFSGAMARQVVDDGMRLLPAHQRQLIKLAYFGGFSNFEIAGRMGINISTVDRGLQQAVARLSEYVERGRAASRKAVYALVLFFCGRSLFDADHLARAAALVAVATVMVASPSSADKVTSAETGTVPVVASVEPQPILNTIAAPLQSAAVQIGTVTEVPLPLPVTLPIRLKTPPLPALPLPHGLLGA
jgi:hypothetical protein